jgi:peptidoglycan/LPS O-acetylase OafA/YrhL
VAVLPVLLFHAEVQGFAGGFFGVDVFFVISGYLITRLILQDLEKGRFSLWQFWERRIRRIMPILLLVTAASIPPAWILMSPDGLQNFGQSVFATIVSANNILLYLTNGYWQIETGFKPLVHTWSLGVEEQFYVIFPLIMLFLFRFPRLLGLGFSALLLVASLTVAEIFSRSNADFAFYLLPTRFWELGAGACTAVALSRWPETSSSLLGAVGFLMIIVSIFLFGPETRHPSLMTLLPVCGTVLFLAFARHDRGPGWYLALPLPVTLGVLSYGIYLRHQPLIAFGRLSSPTHPSTLMLAALAFMAIPLAWISHVLIERPCRDRTRVSVTGLLSGVVLVSVALLSAGYTMHMRGGMPERFFTERAEEMTGAAFARYNDVVRRQSADDFPSPDGLNLLVIGNSYARDFVNMAQEADLFEGYSLVYREDMGNCLSTSTIPDSGPDRLIRTATIIVFASPNPQAICPEIDIATLAANGVSRVYYIGNKHFGYNPDAFLRLDPEARTNARTLPLPEALDFNARLRALVPDGHFVDLFSLLMDAEGKVPVFDGDGLLLSGDRTHLTRPGAAYIGQLLRNADVFDTPTAR